MLPGKIDVIFDTNVLVSYLIGKSLRNLSQHFASGQVRMVLCDELVEELRIVCARPKLDRYLDSTAVSEFINLMMQIGKVHQIRESVNICRDPKDNFLLSLSISSKARYLVTGDSDLLVLEDFRGCKIVSPTEFIALLQ